MRAVPMMHDYAKHQAVARELEKEFGLQSVESVLGPENAKAPAVQAEAQVLARDVPGGKRAALIPMVLTWEQITSSISASSRTATFMAALRERGHRIVKADRRDLCLIDAPKVMCTAYRRLARE